MSSSADQQIINDKITRLDAMRSHRGTFESHWDEVAKVASPKDYNFQNTFSVGDKRRRFQYDSTAELALRRASSFYDSVTTPRNKRWHGLESPFPEINKRDDVREYFDLAENALFTARYAPKAGYAGQRQTQIMALWGFGTAPMFVDMQNRIMRYRNYHLSTTYIQENAWGIIDVVYKCIPMTVRQMVQMFGENVVPKRLQKTENDNPVQTYDVLHTVEPNPNPDPESLKPEDREFVSYYILNDSSGEDGKVMLDRTGYKKFPYSVSRDVQSVGEVYGRSVLMSVLPTIKLLNTMKKTDIQASHMIVHPTALMTDDGSIDPADLIPGRAISGGLDANGNPKVLPYQSGARVDISEQKMLVERDTIREAFLLDLFINQLEREATATEVLTRTQEQARILAPLTGREESESLAVMVERELQILEDEGMLPPMPEALLESSGEFRVRFTSPIANAQKADEAIGATQTLNAALQAAQVDPNVMDKINLDNYIEIQAEANSTPWSMINGEDEVIEIRAKREKQQQEQALLENAQGLSQAALNVANVEQVANGTSG